jgi:hypothetical protein
MSHTCAPSTRTVAGDEGRSDQQTRRPGTATRGRGTQDGRPTTEVGCAWGTSRARASRGARLRGRRGELSYPPGGARPGGAKRALPRVLRGQDKDPEGQTRSARAVRGDRRSEAAAASSDGAGMAGGAGSGRSAATRDSVRRNRNRDRPLGAPDRAGALGGRVLTFRRTALQTQPASGVRRPFSLRARAACRRSTGRRGGGAGRLR